ncbi:MAG: hypothetical protein ABI629_12790 [bacterium]
MNQVSSRAALLRSCAVASAVAAACLGALALLPRPPFALDHVRILSGTATLTAEQLEQYRHYLRLNLSVDGVFLLGQVMTWIGYAVVTRSRVLAASIAIIGIGGAGLDLLENEIRWSVAARLADGAATPAIGTLWEVVVGLSFWASYVAALLAAVAIVPFGRAARLASAVGVFGIAAAAARYEFDFLPSFLWLIAWHVVSAQFLAAESKRG